MSIHYYNAMSSERAPELLVEVSDPTPSGSDSGFSLCSPSPVTSNTTIVTASGGVPPYSYAWTQEGPPATAGPFGTLSPLDSNSQTWSDTRCDNHTFNTETWRCTVTDDAGQEEFIDVVVELTWADIT